MSLGKTPIEVVKTAAAPTPLKVGPSSPPGIRRWHGCTVDVKEFLSRDPRIDKVTVLAKNKGEERVAEILAQKNGDYLLQRVGFARFVGDGADPRFSFLISRA